MLQSYISIFSYIVTFEAKRNEKKKKKHTQSYMYIVYKSKAPIHSIRIGEKYFSNVAVNKKCN